ncbi:uncharacterized protein LY89DRAFT_639458 [Mollisia scopiformis]|uniref:Uncharacterized protein n=1 Tax=Mollisia scopiformis TaxID=149040 RepID=A0A194XP01_MOLSC|nr:uncharacterized protein LY89DRAFT_639458 [Mollisia scopiformis]KUJ21462.1 hypothetical protein LY89DRAFT_639458 [Mollisia scopiformis]
MPSATPPSPSPPPPLPQQSTPGPRATAFTTLYLSALDSTLKSTTYTSFSACFPTVSARAEAALRGMHAGMLERLRGFAVEDFERIMEERRVVERVNGLEDVITEARKRRAAGVDGGWADKRDRPHTLPPKPLMESHTLPLHRAQNGQLNARLQTVQSQNAMLGAEIRAQREEIEELLKKVEGGVGDVEMAGVRLGERVGGLSGEGRTASEVLSGWER